MKQVSRWGQAHPWSARLLLTACSLLLTATALLLGDILFLESVSLPAGWLALPLILTGAALVLYPHKGSRGTYRRRKTLDGLLVGCSFSLLLMLGNGALPAGAGGLMVPAAQASVHTSVPPAEKPARLKQKERRLAKWVGKLRKGYKSLSTGQKILLITLLVAGTLLAGYGVALLACSAACAGAEALGLIILIVGWAGLVILLAHLITRILRKDRRRQKKEAVEG